MKAPINAALLLGALAALASGFDTRADLLPSGQDTNTRRYPRSLAEAFPHGPEYGCAIERPAPNRVPRLLWAGIIALALLALWSNS